MDPWLNTHDHSCAKTRIYKATQINKAESAAANRRPLAYGGDGQRCAQLG